MDHYQFAPRFVDLLKVAGGEVQVRAYLRADGLHDLLGRREAAEVVPDLGQKGGVGLAAFAFGYVLEDDGHTAALPVADLDHVEVVPLAVGLGVALHALAPARAGHAAEDLVPVGLVAGVDLAEQPSGEVLPDHPGRRRVRV